MSWVSGLDGLGQALGAAARTSGLCAEVPQEFPPGFFDQRGGGSPADAQRQLDRVNDVLLENGGATDTDPDKDGYDSANDNADYDDDYH